MTNTIFADLHNHTRASDGELSPRQLVETAKARGIRAVAITDHDTLSGLEQGLAAGARSGGIEVVPGVEMSICFRRPLFTGTLHLLCYFPARRLADRGFVDRFEALLAGGRGDHLVRDRIERINAVFGPAGPEPLLKRNLVFEDIAAYGANASRRHFSLALSRRLGIEDPAAINRIIGNDSPAYLPSGIGLTAAADFINTQKLLAVLAHPAAGSFPGKGHYREVLPPVETVEKLLPEFLDAGIRGIEVVYPGHTGAHQALLRSWAGQYDLLITGGSDCHDDTERPLGAAGICEPDFRRFQAALGG